MTKHIEDWSLNAYADGELDANDRASVEKQLSEDGSVRHALDHIRRQNNALHLAYDSVVSEPVPAQIMAVVKSGEGWRLTPLMSAAAALALLLVGGLGGWFAAHETRLPLSYDLAQDAIVAHEVYTADMRRPFEIGAAEKATLQTWLSKRIGVNVKIPDVTADGYSFLGGRLLTSAGAPAGQLMYEADDKSRLTIFFGTNPTGKEEALRIVKKDDLISCYWQESDFILAVTGDVTLDEMMRLSRDIYGQMES